MLDYIEAILRNPRVLIDDKGYVFIHSHMRSYSSLLCHILANHPEISGYAESHLSFPGKFGLLRLRCKVSISHDHRLDGRYVLDKILHNRHEIASSVLERPDVVNVFMLRTPKDSIRSWANLVAEQGGTVDFEGSVCGYINRMEGMSKTAARIRGDFFYLDAGDILAKTGQTLAFLASVLGLSSGLAPEYQTYKLTGVIGKGDLSENIFSGRIVHKRSTAADIDIPSDLVEKAQNTYDRCRSYLLENCKRVNTP